MTKEIEASDFNSKLSPCPFCGGKAEMGQYSYGNSNYGSGSRLIIRCDNCKLEMHGGDTSWRLLSNCQKEIDELIEKWNRRA